jgi:hypothetical protein
VVPTEFIQDSAMHSQQILDCSFKHFMVVECSWISLTLVWPLMGTAWEYTWLGRLYVGVLTHLLWVFVGLFTGGMMMSSLKTKHEGSSRLQSGSSMTQSEMTFTANFWISIWSRMVCSLVKHQPCFPHKSPRFADTQSIIEGGVLVC